MATSNTIDSNVTGLRYAEEQLGCIGQLPDPESDSVWIPLEPNSYSDFGGEITTVARNPINDSRQRKKGVTTDLDASGGFNMDLTQDNLQDLLQGFFFADLRRKGEAKNAIGSTTLTFSMTAAGAIFTRVGGTLDLTLQFETGDLVFIAGFVNPENNGLFAVGAVTATTLALLVADGSGSGATVVDEAATANASAVQTGVEATGGDIAVDAAGSRPALTSTTLDFTTIGLIPGEFIFIGGDNADNRFVDTNNNGFARVRVITANRLEFDKTSGTMVTEAAGALNIHLYVGRVLKNELAALIKRRTYQLERTLGAPDSTLPSEIQAEYLVGSVPNEFTLNISTADKLTADLSFVAIDHQTIDGPTPLKDGTRVSLVEADAFNTSSDFSRIKLASVNEVNSNPDPLFAFATEITLNINNNVTPNKAVGTLGAIEVTAGTFAVGGDLTAYFSSVAATQAVRDNADITLDAHAVKQNAGISIDLPLISLGNGRATVEQDSPITIPLSNEAATGAKIDSALDHTLLLVFFDYLPDLAE